MEVERAVEQKTSRLPGFYKLLPAERVAVVGDWAEAKRRYDANPQDVADAMGAIAYWYTLK